MPTLVKGRLVLHEGQDALLPFKVLRPMYMPARSHQFPFLSPGSDRTHTASARLEKDACSRSSAGAPLCVGRRELTCARSFARRSRPFGAGSSRFAGISNWRGNGFVLQIGRRDGQRSFEVGDRRALGTRRDLRPGDGHAARAMWVRSRGSTVRWREER